MPLVDVKRTYLEMRSLDALSGSQEDPAGESLVELRPCSLEDARRLYRAVGERYHWRDRLVQADDELRAYLARDDVRVFVARSDGREDGYFELLRQENGEVEVAYFGLMEHAHGRGIGRWLLVRAVQVAFAWGSTRVWLHTCTLDSPAALPNYLARGFVAFREEWYQAQLDEWTR
ncbi:MAG: GNAT family N-acetyltransferase [Cytophagaceae bacterium]|nr:GNAT family N-acetyltransferase [Gemmatimonadaceae bacterium]